MNYKNNFKSAFGELLGTSWGNQDPDSNEATDTSSPKEEEIVFLNKNNQEQIFKSSKPTIGKADEPIFTTTHSSSNPVTVISNISVIQGKILSEGQVDVDGVLEGDVEAKGNVRVTGTVTGNVSGNRIELSSCIINGNITAQSSVNIDSNSKITGDIMAESLSSNGSVKGNITTEGTAVFQNHAVVNGDILAASVTVENGAIICGFMTVRKNPEAHTDN